MSHVTFRFCVWAGTHLSRLCYENPFNAIGKEGGARANISTHCSHVNTCQGTKAIKPKICSYSFKTGRSAISPKWAEEPIIRKYPWAFNAQAEDETAEKPVLRRFYSLQDLETFTNVAVTGWELENEDVVVLQPVRSNLKLRCPMCRL